MYIRKVSKKNGVTKKIYQYLHLVENIRTSTGPRQKLILNLGNIDVHESQFKTLAKRIEDILTGQQSFIQVDEKINKYAKKAADKIFEKQSREDANNKPTDYQDVNLNSLEVENARSFGAEYVCHSVWKELKMNNFFKEHNIPSTIIPVIEAVVLGRVIEPASELHTQGWVENRSSLYELTGAPLRHSLSSYYRASDRLFDLKDELEKYLTKKEQDIFSLNEKYFFFDLTNTYFEGKYDGNSKAKYGRSKEKRSDCKIITLGMVVDENGFSKCSNLFEGNMSDSNSLIDMINILEEKTNGTCKNKTIVMDAGIATEDNINLLKKKDYHYIVVGRGTPPVEMDMDNMELIKEKATAGIKIEVKRYEVECDGEEGKKDEKNKEVYLLCKSKQKQKKEQSMRDRVEKLLIDRLNYLKAGLTILGRMKKYEKIVESIGRLKEKYPKVAKLYTINTVSEKGKSDNIKDIKAIDIIWQKKDKSYDDEIEKEGSYILRTDRTDLSNKEIWEMYIMLRRIEYSFLCMKSYLGLRPNFHFKEERIDMHMFISVIAYHFLQIIECRLRQHGDTRKWATIRDILKTHQRLTIFFQSKNQNGKLINQRIRLNTEFEPEHENIYKKLGLSTDPVLNIRAKFKV